MLMRSALHIREEGTTIVSVRWYPMLRDLKIKLGQSLKERRDLASLVRNGISRSLPTRICLMRLDCIRHLLHSPQVLVITIAFLFRGMRCTSRLLLSRTLHTKGKTTNVHSASLIRVTIRRQRITTFLMTRMW